MYVLEIIKADIQNVIPSTLQESTSEMQNRYLAATLTMFKIPADSIIFTAVPTAGMNRIVIDSILLTEAGHIAVFQDRPAGEKIVLGQSEQLSPGRHDNVQIKLINSLQATTPETRYGITLYHDSLQDDDAQVLRADGEPLAVYFELAE